MTNYRLVVIAFVLGVILSAFAASVFMPSSIAQDNQPQMQPQLEVFTYSTGLTGFYDRNTGLLYLYDTNIEKCTCIRQLVRLGEPMKKLRN
jgi:hypothetical protein